ncbi:hypothetical protein GCM10009795_013740 [Nocardioides hankookensis]
MTFAESMVLAFLPTSRSESAHLPLSLSPDAARHSAAFERGISDGPHTAQAADLHKRVPRDCRWALVELLP